MTEKVAVFIDGSNLYATAKALQLDIDYKRVLDYFGPRLLRAYYYTALLEEDIEGNLLEKNPLIPLLDWLTYNGYSVVQKPTKTFIDADGKTKIKGNMDIEIAVDMMCLSGHVSHMWLFSGDGDFKAVVQEVQKRGVHVTVCSTIAVRPPLIADELRRIVDRFVDLVDMKQFIRDGASRSRYAKLAP